VRNLEFKTILARDVLTETNLTQMRLKDRQIKAVKYIKEHGQITRKDYVNLVSISPRQALIDLTELVEKKVLVAIGKGRASKYSLRN